MVKMEAEGSILFFDDASQDSSEAFEAFLLSIGHGSLALGFIQGVYDALQCELVKLAAADRSQFPRADSIHSLFRRQDGKPLPPALQAAEVVAVQLGSFISTYECQPNRQYPSTTDEIIVGACLGELSAATIRLAASLLNLVPLAVNAVRIAFRLGLLADRISRDIEQPSFWRESWSVVLSRRTGIASDSVLDEIHSQIGLPEHLKTYVSAYSPNTVTLSGPPSSLRQVLNQLKDRGIKVRPLELPIFVPFHAGHIYDAQMISGLLDTLPAPETLRNTQVSIISGSGMLLSDAPNQIELLGNVLRNVLISPIDRGSLSSVCRRELSRRCLRNWSVRPFGPTSPLDNFIASLNGEDDSCVKLEAKACEDHNHVRKSLKAPLAIVGMAGRFPHAANHDQLWEILMEGRDCHQKIPNDRFNSDTHLSNPAYGCFIDSPGMFDARFFNMSPKEALQTEPGQRLTLTTAYEALEMAGFVPNRTASTQLGRIGTFYGQTVDEYKEQNMPQNIGTYFIPGSLRAFGPGRVNRHFKFGGPASSIDTACSSSAVAINAACSAIWNGECDMAVAGGANILTGSDNFIGLSSGHFLSPTGGCKTFDDGADGYCRAEAVASVVIKRMEDATADNDNVLGVILSAATNYSADAISITHPHGGAQVELFQQVVDQAGLRPSNVDYVEMHGTGTQAGDSCEMKSVSSLFAPHNPPRSEDSPLWVSTVKSNLGHGEAASGITSLIKTLLVLREESLPPHIGIKSTLNRKFDSLSERNIRIPMAATPLPSKVPSGDKRRVLVNNFGAAGGNTALIIEEAPTKPLRANIDHRKMHIINITAKTALSLQGNAERILKYLESHPEVSLSDLSYTTTARRIQHRLRMSLVASTVPALKASILTSMPSRDFKDPGQPPDIVFAFGGQGSFSIPLGQDLYHSSSVFRESITRFDKTAAKFGFPTISASVDGSSLEQIYVRPVQAQLSILAVQLGLSDLWAALNVTPKLVIGHSLGEYAALCVSGVLTRSDAIYLVGKRAELQESELRAGSHAMLAVRASVTEITEKLGTTIEVACINGPYDTVLSAETDRIISACDKLHSFGIKATVLQVPYGFHSSQVDPILDRFETIASSIQFGKPLIPILSPLLKRVVRDAGVINAAYLRAQTRGVVDFSGAIELTRNPAVIGSNCFWVDNSPHPLCLSMVKSIFGAGVRGTPTLQKHEDCLVSLARAVSAVSQVGVDIDWNQYHADYQTSQRLLTLPSYHFDEKKYWMEYENDWLSKKHHTESKLQPQGPTTTSVQKLLSQKVTDSCYLSMLFESDLSDPELHAAIIGHSVNGSGLCPASIYADQAMTIARYIHSTYELKVPDGLEIVDMSITRPVVIPHQRPTEQKLLHMAVTGNLVSGELEISFGQHDESTGKTEWSAKCQVVFGSSDNWRQQWLKVGYLIENRIKDLERGTTEGNTNKLLRGLIYRLFSSCVDYEIKYQAMQEVLMRSEHLEAAATLELYRGNEGGTYLCKPFWIDALVHLAGFVMNANDAVDTRNSVYISSGWKSMRFAGNIDPALAYRVHVKMIYLDEKTVTGDVVVLQDDLIVAYIGDLTFQKVPKAVLDVIIPPAGPEPRRSARRTRNSLTPPMVALERVADMGDLPKLDPFNSSPEMIVGEVFDIIAEEIGITTPEVFQIDNFDEMGVDSLLSIAITARLKCRDDVELDHRMFHLFNTAADLHAHLIEYVQNHNDGSTSSSTTEEIVEAVTPGNSAVNSITLLHCTIAEQLGVAVQDLYEVQTLSELGLDSLAGIQLVDTLQDLFGVKMKPDLLLGGVTLSSVEYMVGLPSSDQDSSSAYFPDPGLPHCSPEVPVRTQAALPRRLSMVLYDNGTLQSNMAFLFPDGSGSPAIYAQLQPMVGRLIGLQSPYIYCPEEFRCSVESLVSLWVDEIRRLQPHGPHFLIGYSAGGYFAFEAARQLLDVGTEVEHLLLIDSPSRVSYEAMPAELPQWLAKNGIIGARDNDRVVRHFSGTIDAIEGYMPKPLQGNFPVTIIWASQGVLGTSGSHIPLPSTVEKMKLTKWLLTRPKARLATDGWETLLPEANISVRVTPGHHFNLFGEENCPALTCLVNTIMSASS